MFRSPRVRTAMFAVVGLLVLLAAWVAWQVWQVSRDLSAAVDDANSLRTAVGAHDQATLDHELAELTRHSAAASGRTSGITWRVLDHVPLLGADARAVSATSEVVNDLAQSGVAPLASVSDRLDTMLPRGGAIDVKAIARLQAPVLQAQTAFAAADQRLATIDSSRLIGPLQVKFDQFRDEVGLGARAMTTAKAAVEMLPTALGGSGPQNYLLVFQNNAEIRATGGLPGAVAEIRAARGRISITRQVAGADLGVAQKMPLPLEPAERKLFGSVFGRYFLDANFTPDVPRAADLMRARWQQVHPHDRIDGVFLIDTVSLSYLLDQTGPIEVDGIQLSGANVVQELLSTAYRRLNPKQQNVFFAHVAKSAFEKFTTGLSNGAGVLKALARSATEGRLYLHSFDPALQDLLAGSQMAGDELSHPATDRPQVLVTVNDSSASKMAYYLQYQVDVNATYCVGQVQGLALKMHLRSTAPADGGTRLPRYVTGIGDVPRGDNLVVLRIYGPVGGVIRRLYWNDAPMNLIRTETGGRPVAMTYIQLKPGQAVDLDVAMESGPGEAGDTDVFVTPSVQQTNLMSTLPSACGA